MRSNSELIVSHNQTVLCDIRETGIIHKVSLKEGSHLKRRKTNTPGFSYYSSANFGITSCLRRNLHVHGPEWQNACFHSLAT